jgi:hypothetical protein
VDPDDSDDWDDWDDWDVLDDLDDLDDLEDLEDLEEVEGVLEVSSVVTSLLIFFSRPKDFSWGILLFLISRKNARGVRIKTVFEVTALFTETGMPLSTS